MGLKAHHPPFLLESKLSWIRYLEGKLLRGVLTFINARFNANRDLFYHDYHTDETKTTYQSYVVGVNNNLGNGDQHKLFVSKSTLIYCTENMYIVLNSSENVPQLLLAGIFYEFKSNIRQIHYASVADTPTIYIWTEGVLPQEAGVAE